MFFYTDLYDPMTCTMCHLLEFNLSYLLFNFFFPIKQHKMTLVGTCSFVALSRPGPPVVFILLARCFADFPSQHAQPGPPAVFILVARYFVALSLGPTPCPWAPRPAYTCGTLVAHCFTGLSFSHLPRWARSGWTLREHKTRCGSFRDLISVSYVEWSKSKTPVTDKRTMRLISGPRFCQFFSLGCHLGGCRIDFAEIVNESKRHVIDRLSELIYRIWFLSRGFLCSQNGDHAKNI